MKTCAFDEKLYKIVPLEPDEKICVAGQEYSKGKAWGYAGCYTAMIATVSNDLPGVVVHTGEPVAYRVTAPDGHTFLFDNITKPEIWESMAHKVDRLYAHPAPDAAIIVKAALEAAANLMDGTILSESSSFGEDIRALSPVAILAGMK